MEGDIMDYKNMTAPCGIGCFICPMYLAGENEELRAKISKNTGILFEQAICLGCRNEKGKPEFLNWDEPCNVYKCIGKKGLSFCCDCPEFPCDHLHPYADRASEVQQNIKVFNLSVIKKLGLESWAKTKSKSIRDTYFKGKFKV